MLLGLYPSQFLLLDKNALMLKFELPTLLLSTSACWAWSTSLVESAPIFSHDSPIFCRFRRFFVNFGDFSSISPIFCRFRRFFVDFVNFRRLRWFFVVLANFFVNFANFSSVFRRFFVDFSLIFRRLFVGFSPCFRRLFANLLSTFIFRFSAVLALILGWFLSIDRTMIHRYLVLFI